MTNEEAIKYLIQPFATSTKLYNEYLKQKEAYELAIKALEERPTGKWIVYKDNYGNDKPVCSCCHKEQVGYANYCSYCGRRMREVTYETN